MNNKKNTAIIFLILFLIFSLNVVFAATPRVDYGKIEFKPENIGKMFAQGVETFMVMITSVLNGDWLNNQDQVVGFLRFLNWMFIFAVIFFISNKLPIFKDSNKATKNIRVVISIVFATIAVIFMPESWIYAQGGTFASIFYTLIIFSLLWFVMWIHKNLVEDKETHPTCFNLFLALIMVFFAIPILWAGINSAFTIISVWMVTPTFIANLLILIGIIFFGWLVINDLNKFVGAECFKFEHLAKLRRTKVKNNLEDDIGGIGDNNDIDEENEKEKNERDIKIKQDLEEMSTELEEEKKIISSLKTEIGTLQIQINNILNKLGALGEELKTSKNITLEKDIKKILKSNKNAEDRLQELKEAIKRNIVEIENNRKISKEDIDNLILEINEIKKTIEIIKREQEMQKALINSEVSQEQKLIEDEKGRKEEKDIKSKSKALVVVSGREEGQLEKEKREILKLNKGIIQLIKILELIKQRKIEEELNINKLKQIEYKVEDTKEVIKEIRTTEFNPENFKKSHHQILILPTDTEETIKKKIIEAQLKELEEIDKKFKEQQKPSNKIKKQIDKIGNHFKKELRYLSKKYAFVFDLFNKKVKKESEITNKMAKNEDKNKKVTNNNLYHPKDMEKRIFIPKE